MTASALLASGSDSPDDLEDATTNAPAAVSAPASTTSNATTNAHGTHPAEIAAIVTEFTHCNRARPDRGDRVSETLHS